MRRASKGTLPRRRRASTAAPLPLTFAVILAGGRSTRFWPLARRARPKQLLRLHGRGTLLQQTARRLRRLVPWSRILVVTTPEYAAPIRQQLPRLAADHVLVEPQGRGTAPCLGLVAEWVRARVGDAVLVSAPADHRIDEEESFVANLRQAIAAAAHRPALVTLGARPTHAETGYGYIEAGKPIASTALRRVRRFREKPTPTLAKRLLRNPANLWNTGIFVWRASTFLAALHQELPNTAQRLSKAAAGSDPEKALSQAYRRVDSVSVDVGVLEPLSQRRLSDLELLVLPVHFPWSDVGTWSAMSEVWGSDAQGNSSVGPFLPLDAERCILHAPHHTVAILGVSDLVVVEVGDALLVCARDRAQDVRRVVEELRRKGLRRLL